MTTALPPPDIPNRPEDLTAEWLGGVLRAHGAIGDGVVKGLETRVVGEGEGFLGAVVRIALELEGASDDAPRSLIGKFPTQVPENRQIGETLGVYEREIRFYRELAERVPMRMPRLYYADLDPSGIEGREEKIYAFLDRFPVWLIRICTPLLRWIVGKSKRRYALLLEDLAPATTGDQLSGCSVAVAKDVLRPLAEMHASFWNQTDDPALAWIPRFEIMRRWAHTDYRAKWRGFVEQHEATLPRICALAPWLDRHGVGVIEALSFSPYTLLHGDYRLDNMTLALGEGGVTIPTVFDWQTPMRGPGGVELAYFVSGNLDADTAERSQAELLAFYREQLGERGVDYPLATLERDYQLGLVWEAWRMIFGLEEMDFSNSRGQALMETWMQRVDRLLPESCEALLD